MSEVIEITGVPNQNNAKWHPYQGDEIVSLIKHKGFIDANGNLNTAGEKIIDETIKILEMCGNPADSENIETGLVIGYVQSGKTLSFTALTALAHDNNYQIIIIIAGISKLLSEQTYQRMKKDLRDESRFDRRWTIIANAGDGHRDIIEKKLQQWKEANYPREKCSTILITVMKQGNRLQNLTQAFRGIPLIGVPTLIIDDESDQASLNTKSRANFRSEGSVNEGEASTIYRRINELKNVFPHHTFLQYTATPQANLFINIMDRLSPNFIKLLTPGDGYTGGRAFFLDNPQLIRSIPTIEIPTNQNPIHEAPNSLLYALKVFFLGVAIGEMIQDSDNRTMMVHPSRLTNSQNEFYNWIILISENWKRLLGSTSLSDKEDKDELIEDFRNAYNDLSSTVENIPPFDELMSSKIIWAIRDTRIMEINASRGKTPEIQWNVFYSFILVGGQAMDRGFTVEGLTVTYMPRPLATGQVDTTLQRARFFGYKGKYLGFCRVWLDEETIEAYVSIIEHEEDVRGRLEEFNVNNKHLNEWERELVLNRMLKITRSNILFDETYQYTFGRDWFQIHVPHDTDSLIPFNQNSVNTFVLNFFQDFKEDPGHDERADFQKHLVLNCSLASCLEQLLIKLKFTRESDSQPYASLRGVIKNIVERNPEERCLVYLMSARIEDDKILHLSRGRRLRTNGTIQQLFQGKQPTKDGKFRQGEVYPGDREIKNNNLISIQIHKLNIKDSSGNSILDENGMVIYENVINLAIWMPQRFSIDIIRQPDNS